VAKTGTKTGTKTGPEKQGMRRVCRQAGAGLGNPMPCHAYVVCGCLGLKGSFGENQRSFLVPGNSTWSTAIIWWSV